jgi:plasmid stabilization system protein ParE
VKQIRFHPKVPAEARASFDYYGSISEALGEDFWAELTSAFEEARTHPERHHFDASGLRRSNLRRFPVHFLFRIFPDHIRITVIRHDRSHPSQGIKRK